MQNFYLIDYIKKNLNIEPAILESIKYELDQQIYYYGDQFKYPKERQRHLFDSIKERIKRIIIGSIVTANSFIPKQNFNGTKNILSNAYFSTNLELKKLGYNVYRPVWNLNRELNVLCNYSISKEYAYFSKFFHEETFINLISAEFIRRIQLFQSILKQYFLSNEIAALFAPNDMGFFENLSIQTCKQISKPSFIFLHGLPGRYNNIDENKTDYLIVWGEKIKEHYVAAGISEYKIFVSGHPYYKALKNKELKFNMDSPLVITKSMNGAQHNDKVRLSDRGNLILYLYSLQSVLKKFGVNRVRFRPHPSENFQWYYKFIDNNFYQVDQDDLPTSLQKSTIVIGPTSTVCLEALYEGVNYICYEPSQNDIELTNFKLVPPFDGSDERLPVAKNEEQLERIIKEKIAVDSRVFNDYIKTPFDLSFVKSLI